MKRQRNSQGDHEGVVAATAAMQEGKSEERKRSKWAVEEEGEEGLVVAAAAAENWVEDWAWLRLSGEGLADEQMSWGYFTLPKWGVEFMIEAYGYLFSDVVWDDDIWNLKSIHEIPANL